MLPDFTITARLRRLRDQLLVLAGEAGGAEDVDLAGLGGELGIDHAGGGNGEIDEPVGARKQRRGVGRHLDAVGAEARKLAGVAPDHRGARRIDRARERDAVGRRDGLDQRAAHAPAGAGHDQPHVGHGDFSSVARV